MYRYDEFDKQFIQARIAEFSDQVTRRLTGEISEEEFTPLRLRNGVYLQLHAYMLRIAIPYGTLSSQQMRKLAYIASHYDRDYGHFTTRQNIQFNWLALSDIPAILSHLAEVDMHAIQTSGNCIRNITTDPFAGAACDEYADPRPYAEILRQWSSLHPEFSYLPRKFKFAISGGATDRAAIQVHDIGLQLKKNEKGELGFAFYVGGGQGRTPMIAKLLHPFIPEQDLLRYSTAIIRIYNLYGRRDNKYKARIKILLHEIGLETFSQEIEAEYAQLKSQDLHLPPEDIAAITAYFQEEPFQQDPAGRLEFETMRQKDPAFAQWVRHNITNHKYPDYAIVTLCLKAPGGIPGDATTQQMMLVADLADRYSRGEIRISHQQNLVLPHIALKDLYALYQALASSDLAHANKGLISDMIVCPGLDYCSLANARSIPIAQEISSYFFHTGLEETIGDLRLNISGCINACAHHHVAHIGILGVEKKGTEYYQITLGGESHTHCAIGQMTGRGFTRNEIVPAIATLIETYLTLRTNKKEQFIETWKRVGMIPFQQALYPAAHDKEIKTGNSIHDTK